METVLTKRHLARHHHRCLQTPPSSKPILLQCLAHLERNSSPCDVVRYEVLCYSHPGDVAAAREGHKTPKSQERRDWISISTISDRTIAPAGPSRPVAPDGVPSPKSPCIAWVMTPRHRHTACELKCTRVRVFVYDAPTHQLGGVSLDNEKVSLRQHRRSFSRVCLCEVLVDLPGLENSRLWG